MKPLDDPHINYYRRLKARKRAKAIRKRQERLQERYEAKYQRELGNKIKRFL